MLTDSRVLAKVDPDPDEIDSPCFTGDSFIWILENLSPRDILDLLGVIFDKLMLNICQDDQTDTIIDQSLNLLKLFVEGNNTSVLMKKLDAVNDLIKNTTTKYNILHTPDQLKHLSKFYAIVSTLWGVNDGLDNFNIYISPIA